MVTLLRSFFFRDVHARRHCVLKSDRLPFVFGLLFAIPSTRPICRAFAMGACSATLDDIFTPFVKIGIGALGAKKAVAAATKLRHGGR